MALSSHAHLHGDDTRPAVPDFSLMRRDGESSICWELLPWPPPSSSLLLAVQMRRRVPGVLPVGVQAGDRVHVRALLPSQVFPGFSRRRLEATPAGALLRWDSLPSLHSGPCPGAAEGEPCPQSLSTGSPQVPGVALALGPSGLQFSQQQDDPGLCAVGCLSPGWPSGLPCPVEPFPQLLLLGLGEAKPQPVIGRKEWVQGCVAGSIGLLGCLKEQVGTVPSTAGLLLGLCMTLWPCALSPHGAALCQLPDVRGVGLADGHLAVTVSDITFLEQCPLFHGLGSGKRVLGAGSRHLGTMQPSLAASGNTGRWHCNSGWVLLTRAPSVPHRWLGN